MMALLKRTNGAIDSWLLTPEANAAGRLGLFRILYALFYYWHLSTQSAQVLSGIPAEFLERTVFVVAWLPPGTPPTVFIGLETLLVAALAFLLVGYKTRVATAIVLICGTTIEASFIRADFEHSTLMIAAVIPGVMLLIGDWSGTYSVDAVLGRRSGRPTVSPEDTSEQFVLPIRVVFLALVLLFFSSGVFKILPSANWLTQSDMLGNITLNRNIDAVRLGLPGNPLAAFFARTPGLELVTRYLVVVFELAFILALFSRRMRFFCLSGALFFHSLNAIFLLVTFSPILITYGLLFDVHGLWQRIVPQDLKLPHGIGTKALIGVTILIVIGVTALWSSTPLRSIFNLGGMLNWYTLWYPVFPIAIVAWIKATTDLLRLALKTKQPQIR